MDTNALLRELELDEGVRLAPYRDTRGYLSIGIGRCLDTNPVTPEETAYIGHDCRKFPITEGQARYLAGHDVARTCLRLSRALPWWSRQPEEIQRVLANMAFNLGVPGLLSFKNTLGAIERGAYADAAKAMRASLWAHQVKGRAERLAKRVEEYQK